VGVGKNPVWGVYNSINGVVSEPAKHALQAILYQANYKMFNVIITVLFISKFFRCAAFTGIGFVEAGLYPWRHSGAVCLNFLCLPNFVGVRDCQRLQSNNVPVTKF